MQNYLNSLSGLNILITGASSGIGRSTALALAENGCQVFVTARRKERLIELRSQYPDNIHVLAGDITNTDFLEQLNLKGFFEVDILINNAGLALGKDSFEKSKD